MRFRIGNWKRCFDGHNKITTLRLHKSKEGQTNAFAGSYHHPKKLGEFKIVKIMQIKYEDLTECDARLDGFDSLRELQAELRAINGEIQPETILYQHFMLNIISAEGDLTLNLPPSQAQSEI